MKFGLSEDQIRQIRDVLARHPKIIEAVIFGSRAMGNYKEASDVDIALEGDVNASLAAKVKAELEEDTLLPFFFDVVAYPTIDNPELKKHIDTFGVSMYRPGWHVAKFSQYVEISPRVSLKAGQEYSFVEMKDLEDGRRYCSPSSQRKLSGGSRFQDGDTLFARITPCLENGKICQVRGLKNGVGFGSTEFFVFRGKEGFTNNDFVFYLSRSDEVRSFAEQNFDGTSGRQRVPKAAFDSLNIVFPPLPIQHSIARVLTSLDDKIDLLHRQNKTLEGMAAAMLQKMMVEEEAMGGWEEKPLSAITKRITDGSHVSPKTVEEGLPMASVKDMTEWGIDFESCRRISPEDYKKLVAMDCRPLKGDVLIAKDGSYLKHVFVAEQDMDIVILSSIAILRPNEKYDPLLLALFLKLESTRNSLENIVTGAVIPRIVLKDFREFMVPVPPKNVQTKALETIRPLIEKCWVNNKRILVLKKMRDLLLPKMISGEVMVKA